eukprot:TRINITY_DN46765_c0_g1_i1.p2 TRINITY_DN46765_c0_g1~~TRINITY_DN46765_c0_g1_i1.p2  ORF type:complete len:115 (-),score=13.72 TRINITY_DN46765_c0_g1_i1:546-860(-)
MMEKDLPSEDIRPPVQTGYEDQLIEDGIWQCVVCTLVNPVRLSLCDACGNANSQASSALPSSGAMASGCHGDSVHANREATPPSSVNTCPDEADLAAFLKEHRL